VTRRPIPFHAVAGAAWLVCAAEAATGREPGVTLCPFKLLTGWPCPGCGMGHAVVAAMRGNLAASFAYHPLGPPLLVLWTAWLGWGLANLARGRGFSDGFLPALGRPAFAWAALALVLAVYAVRLTLGLAPV
jgi:Protein of unknown function (DUF2752)